MSMEESVPISSVAQEVQVHDISMTNPSVLMGTVAYMSPQQARGEPVDARTDVWSLGVVLSEMVCGHLPFGDNGSHEITSAIVSREPSRLTQPEGFEVPEEVASSLRKRSRSRKKNGSQAVRSCWMRLRIVESRCAQRSSIR